MRIEFTITESTTYRVIVNRLADNEPFTTDAPYNAVLKAVAATKSMEPGTVSWESGDMHIKVTRTGPEIRNVHKAPDTIKVEDKPCTS